MSKKPTVLMILDGFGLNDKTEGNAVAQANKPNIDALMKDYPWVKGNASGLAVGLPDGQMGNSEVGHMNMGAGRIVYQELTRITKEIEDGDFFKNEALLAGMKNVKDNGSALHLYGLLSAGGIHSHITHLFGLLEMAKKEGLDKVYVHCFLDGRDTPPASGKSYVEQLQAKMDEIGVGEITLRDIIKELQKPGRDPRDEMPRPILRTDVLDMKDLKVGMILKGTVRNVIDFGAFVDIGVHQDGLVHISQMTKRFIKHPLEAVSVGDIVEVKVISLDLAKKRIGLSMLLDK